MNPEHAKRRLTKREQDLTRRIAQFNGEAREANVTEVEDTSDEATSSAGTAAALEESTMLSAALRQVQDALQRIENGTYGRCVDCGRSIEPARLEAVPWAPYCLSDQEKHDRQEGTTVSSTL